VWAAISRVDCVDEEILGWMRRAGCTQISYGVESGSREIRNRYHKRISEAAICRAFDLTVRYGIMARAYFIYGAPGESDQTIDESLALIRRIRPLSAIFYILDLFPGTALYEDYKQRTGTTDDIWLDRVEDMLYFETDATLSKATVLSFGRRLREGYLSMLPEFARQIDLVDDPELYPLHADFLSRLALTFSHGDYAINPLVENNLATAVMLFERSLQYHPDHRAFWGLGLVYQHLRRFDESLAILQRGIEHHKTSPGPAHGPGQQPDAAESLPGSTPMSGSHSGSSPDRRAAHPLLPVYGGPGGRTNLDGPAETSPARLNPKFVKDSRLFVHK
jgi:anaerobic magnesium-protoporphyrin IX monomethyl ester cyclase